ncbi:unnamed protein product, partial [Prorocentrum cordatum]
ARGVRDWYRLDPRCGEARAGRSSMASPSRAALAALGALAANAPWLMLSASPQGSRAAWGWSTSTIKCMLPEGVLCASDNSTSLGPGEECTAKCESGAEISAVLAVLPIVCPQTGCANVTAGGACTQEAEAQWATQVEVGLSNWWGWCSFGSECATSPTLATEVATRYFIACGDQDAVAGAAPRRSSSMGVAWWPALGAVAVLSGH